MTLHLVPPPKHPELARILAMTEPTPDMLRAAAERPACVGGKSSAILAKHRRRKKADVPGARRWMFGGGR